MKQKMVIKVPMNKQKSWIACFSKTKNKQECRSKAMKIIVGVSGVMSAALQGDDKNKIEVTGYEIDAVVLVTLLREKVGHAEIESISQIDEEKKKDNKAEEVHKYEAILQHPHIFTSYPHCQPLYEYVPSHEYSNCSIL